LVAAAANEGILVHGLATARFDPEAGPPGLIIGYGNVTAAGIAQGIRELAQMVR
jgi:hypothetical protein